MYEPVKPSGYGIAVFTALVTTQSFLSLSVHFGSDNLFSMMVPHAVPAATARPALASLIVS